MNCSPPGSSVHGIFQARILEWVAIFFNAFPFFSVLIPIQSIFRAPIVPLRAFNAFHFVLFVIDSHWPCGKAKRKADFLDDQAAALCWLGSSSILPALLHPCFPSTCTRLLMAGGLPPCLRAPCHSHRWVQVMGSRHHVSESN